MAGELDVTINTLGQYRYRSVNSSGIPGAWNSLNHVVSAFREKRMATQTSTTSNGWRIPLPFEHWGYETLSPPNARCRVRSKLNPLQGQDWEMTGDTAASMSSRRNCQHNTELDFKAVSGALERLKNQRFNAGVFIAEGRKTIDMIRKRSTTIAQDIRTFKKTWGKKIYWKMRGWQTPSYAIKKAKQYRVKQAARAWLEMEYGWNPFLSEVFGAVNQCAILFTRTEAREFVQFRAQEAFYRQVIVPSEVNPNAKFRVSQRVERLSHVRIDVKLDLPALQLATQLGLTNPADILWETIPFSFVLDWFIPIGRWLHGFDAGLGYSFKGGSHSRISKVTDRSAFAISGENASATYQLFGEPLLNRSYRFNRSVFGSFPVGIPVFRNPFSIRRAISAISLIAVALR